MRLAESIARDPFALELIKNALVALADEMALTIYRTARSFVVKEALDFSTALFLADGQLIAQGTCLPFHLGAMPFAVAAVMRAYAGRSPRRRPLHHQRPVRRQHAPARHRAGQADLPRRRADRLFGRACAHDRHRRSHSRRQCERLDGDLPGRIAHSAVSALARRRARRDHGTPDREERSRSRTRCWAISARWSRPASSASARRSSWRSATVRRPSSDACRDLMDYTERFTRAEIAKLPKGTWRFVDYLDGDGSTPDRSRSRCRDHRAKTA